MASLRIKGGFVRALASFRLCAWQMLFFTVRSFGTGHGCTCVYDWSLSLVSKLFTEIQSCAEQGGLSEVSFLQMSRCRKEHRILVGAATSQLLWKSIQ